MNFTVKNVGRSTALNVTLVYEGVEHELQAIPAGGQERAVRTLTYELVDRIATPTEQVEIEYEDAVGNRLQTICSLASTPNHPMYETRLRGVDGWMPLKAA